MVHSLLTWLRARFPYEAGYELAVEVAVLTASDPPLAWKYPAAAPAPLPPPPPDARPPGCCGCMPPVYGLETTEAAEASCGCCGSIWCAPSAASLLPPEVLAPFSAVPPPPLVIPSATPTAAAAAAENSTPLSQPAAAEWCNAAEVVSPKVSWRTSQNRSQCLLFYHIKWIP